MTRTSLAPNSSAAPNPTRPAPFKIFRYEVPVDDQWHHVDTHPSRVLHVGCRDPRVVEFWAAKFDSTSGEGRWLRVFGTGQPIPAGSTYLGTAIAPGGVLVWHLVAVSEVPA